MAKRKLFKIAPEQARKLWIKALRSGKFEQTIGTLADRDNGQIRYCCLGIACKLFSQHEPEQSLVQKQLKDGRFVWGKQSRMLPSKVKQWLGLSDNIGDYKMTDQWGYTLHSLSEMNDDGMSFVDISDIIEREPEGLLHVSD